MKIERNLTNIQHKGDDYEVIVVYATGSFQWHIALKRNNEVDLFAITTEGALLSMLDVRNPMNTPTHFLLHREIVEQLEHVLVAYRHRLAYLMLDILNEHSQSVSGFVEDVRTSLTKKG